DDAQLLSRRKRDEALIAYERARGLHRLAINGQQLGGRRMTVLDLPRRRLDLLGERGELVLRLGEQRLALRQQLRGVDAQEVFFLEQQVIVLGADGVD